MQKSNKAAARTLGTRLTVRRLTEGMKEKNLSPEQLADLVPLSNMTVRRLLRQAPETVIPEKHAVHLQAALEVPDAVLPFMSKTGGIFEVVDHLENDGAKIEDTRKVHADLKKKLLEVSKELKKLASDLWKYAATKKSNDNLVARSIAIGAILYFINPFDLIPDSIPVVGYLDDFAVMTLALTQIHKITSKDPV